MTLEEAFLITEKLEFRKIKYNNFKHDPNPNILVLDDNYKNNCILAFNLNYFKKGKDAKKKLNKISDLAEKAKLNKLDTYKEIKKEFPECIKYLRTYKKEKIQ